MVIEEAGSGERHQRRIRLAFVGDVCLASNLEDTLVESSADSPLKYLHRMFENIDAVVGNLECCIAGENAVSDLPKNRMVVPRTLTPWLARFGFNVLSLANNHVRDAGPTGIASTACELERIGIRHFGAGGDLDAAEAAVMVEIGGAKIAFLGANDVPEHFAADGRAGVAPMKASRLKRRVHAASAKADLVVVVLHADLEFSRFPSPLRMRLSRALIAHGAGLVIQHHPHVAQGIERHRDGLIAYSLGNFVFSVADNPYLQRTGTDWGIILYVDVLFRDGQKQISWRVEPVTIEKKGLPFPSEAMHRTVQLRQMEEMSTGLSDRRLVRQEWLKRCVAEACSTYYVLSHARQKRGLISAMHEGIRLLANPYERRWMYGLLSGGHLG